MNATTSLWIAFVSATPLTILLVLEFKRRRRWTRIERATWSPQTVEFVNLGLIALQIVLVEISVGGVVYLVLEIGRRVARAT